MFHSGVPIMLGRSAGAVNSYPRATVLQCACEQGKAPASERRPLQKLVEYEEI